MLRKSLGFHAGATNPPAEAGVPANPGQASPSPPNGREGSVVVEFAFIMVVVTTLVLGTFEISRALMVRQVLTDAARKACRLGIQGTATNSTLTTDISGTLSENGLSVSNATVTILVNGQSADVSSARARVDPVSVQVSIPSSSVRWTTNFLMTGMNIRSQAVVMLRQQ